MGETHPMKEVQVDLKLVYCLPADGWTSYEFLEPARKREWFNARMEIACFSHSFSQTFSNA